MTYQTLSPTGGDYRTLEDVFRLAPPGAVVVAEDGTYAPPKSTRTTPLTLLARNEGKAVIARPLGTIPGSGAWQKVTLTGPGLKGAPPGATYQVWHWKAPVAPWILGYADSPDGLPMRLAPWDRKGTDLATREGWAEKLHTNKTYRYGFTVFPATGGADVYARFPGDADPNTLHVSGGTDESLFILNGPRIRLSGFTFRLGHARLNAGASFCVLDRNRFELVELRLYGAKPNTFGVGHVVEHNTFLSTGLWSDDQQRKPSIPWPFMKEKVINADGTAYAERIGAAATQTAVFGSGGARLCVFRHNTIDGYFNAFTNYAPDYAPQARGSFSDCDFHHNTIRHIADDAFEPSFAVSNWRVWNNRVEHATVFCSPGPTHYGPLVFWRNTAWRLGTAGLAPTLDGKYGASGKGFKYSGSSNPPARVFVLGCTLWTDDPGNNGAGISGGENSAGGSTSPEAFYVRDSILRFTRSAFGAPNLPGRWDEDRNHFASSNPARGLQVSGVSGHPSGTFTTDVVRYRLLTGQGQHTNEHAPFTDAAWLDAQLEDPANGDLRVKPGSRLEGKGAG